MSTTKIIPISNINPPQLNIRNQLDIDKLTELAESIKEVGLINDITVRQTADGYEVESGKRRFYACKQLGLKSIRCKIVKSDDEQAVVRRVHENLYREDITPLEEAQIVCYLHYELKWDLSQIESKLRKSRAWVETRIDIFNMPSDLKSALENKQIGIAVAQQLFKVEDELKRKYFLELSVLHGATSRQVMQWIIDFHKENFTPSPDSVHEMNTIQTTPMPTGLIECYICSQGTNPVRAMNVNICQGCWTDIYQSKKNLRKEPPMNTL